ncbi:MULTISPECIES: ABC transporter permease [Halorussus]|uniref:ABC transporter permease n=1 Tax=Halorussus TaxID=1070314 RepID=UPI000E211187|nr:MULTISPECIES: ABC transporter permease [Halorussus]NHN58339.1 ABC transporter permease [Halorussus sp. JP-T4]
MATQNSPNDTFEDVDWDEETSGHGLSLSTRDKGLAAVLAAMTGLFIYDALIVPDGEPTFGAVGWSYSVSQLDWLFALTLVALFFFAVVPMYQNPRMTRYYWEEFKKNRPAMVSLGYLITIFVVGIVGPLFISKPELALLEKYQPPMFTAVDTSYVIECAGEVSNGLCHGSTQYPLGTTGDGKSIFKIVVYGMQVSMKIGLISALLVMVIGSVVGTVAAYAGGLVDEVLMRYVDIQMVFPTFIAYLLITYMYEPSLFLFVLMFGGLTWGNNARYVRSNALQKTEEEYIKAAKTSGASTWHIIRRHLIPNTASSIITDLTLLIPSFILFEASLSFLGLGDPTVPSWGQVIAAGRSDLSFAWWISTIPGIFLFFTILAYNFLGDALLDALNPQADSESET